MEAARDIHGVLLDSGDTLMRPRGGRWNPRFDFEEVVSRQLGTLPRDRLPAAVAAGDTFLEGWSARAKAVGYAAARAEYHRVVLRVLGVDEPTAELLDELDRPLPFTEIVEPFDDTSGFLAWVRGEGLSVAIVADTARGMIDVYRHHGLDELVDTFVISEALGVTKPNALMYRTASDALGLRAEQCLFVDDNPTNVDAAMNLGYRACCISRFRPAPIDGRVWVERLDELRPIIRPPANGPPV